MCAAQAKAHIGLHVTDAITHFPRLVLQLGRACVDCDQVSRILIFTCAPRSCHANAVLDDALELMQVADVHLVRQARHTPDGLHAISCAVRCDANPHGGWKILGRKQRDEPRLYVLRGVRSEWKYIELHHLIVQVDFLWFILNVGAMICGINDARVAIRP